MNILTSLRIILLFLISTVPAPAAGNNTEGVHLRPFVSDKCTLSPEGWWGHCCMEHDVSYWMGGTREQRQAADLHFKACIKKAHGPDFLYYLVVRAFGSAETPADYRWGFGWNNSYEYRTHSQEDLELIEHHLHQWRQTHEYQEYLEQYISTQKEEPWF